MEHGPAFTTDMKKVLFLFGELNDADVDWLISCGRKEDVAMGSTLIDQGKRIDAFYIVLEGAFDVRVAGRQEPIGLVAPGEILGEMSFLDSRAASTTIRAAAPSSVYCVPREALSERLKEDPGFGARFYRSLCIFLSHRLRRLTVKIGDAAAESAEATEAADELDSQVLDGVYLAGKRFHRIVRSVSGS